MARSPTRPPSTLGLALDPRDLLPLYVPVARGVMTFLEVRLWFEARLAPP